MTMIKAPFQGRDVPIGTKFTIKRPEYKRNMEVIDIYKTYNNSGDLVKTSYVCKGELSTDYDVCKVTIQHALMEQSK